MMLLVKVFKGSIFLFGGEYKIYSIECVENISNFTLRSTRKLLIFSTHEMKYFGSYRKKGNFLFIFSVKGNNLIFFLVISR